jgi:hypothetical protein
VVLVDFADILREQLAFPTVVEALAHVRDLRGKAELWRPT